MADSQAPSNQTGENLPLKQATSNSSAGALITRWCLISCCVVSLLALLAIIGWHTGNAALFQVFPQFAPMQYNTAVCFISTSLAVYCAMRKWQIGTFLTVTPAFLISLLTLAQHLFGIQCGNLDEFFHDAYVTTRTLHPGRPSYFTTLSFVLANLALFSSVIKTESRLASLITYILSSLVASISLLALSGYLVGLSDARSWTILAQMSIPTVVCFLLLSSNILGSTWLNNIQHNQQKAGWAPIAVLIASSTVTLILASSIRTEELRNSRVKTHSNAIAVSITLTSELRDRQQSIRRMANRWATSGVPIRARWEADVQEYLADDVGYSFIAWADENLTYQWIVPEVVDIAPGVTSGLPQGSSSMDIVSKLRRSANVGILRLGADHSQLSIVAPIISDDGTMGGYIIADFNDRSFFSSLLPKELAQGYDFKIFMGDKLAYQRNTGDLPKDHTLITDKTFHLYGSDWKIQLWPKAKTLRTEHIAYSKLIAGIGLISSALLAVGVFLAQVASNHSKQAARRNVQLQEEIAEKVRSQEQLKRASALNQAIVEHSAHAVITTDPEGVITSFNPAAERMLGYKAEEVVGKHTPAIIHDLGEVAARASQLSRTYGKEIKPGFEVFVYESSKGIQNQLDWTYVRKNGSRFPVSLAVTTITDENGKITGHLGVAVDISELVYTMAELKKTHKQLLDAALENSRMKSQFLANMSHEIRTPMNGVLGMAELLEATNLTETQREYVSIINESGSALLAIINDILDSAKIESGKIKLQHTPFDIHEVVRGALETVRPAALKKKIGLQSEMDDQIIDQLVGDPGRLRQILLNLVSNAVKFTHQGGVTLSIQLLEQSDEAYRLHFKVSDTGIGINKEHLPHIFDSFTQVDDTNKRAYGGTGLGLTISSQIVEAMGGCIKVQSDEGKGSEFWFELRFKRAPRKTEQQGDNKSPETAASSESTASNIKNLRILLAEDNLVNQQVTSMQLKQLGNDPDIAANGSEVMDALKKKSYDVILMDCQMPIMDGYETAQKIREQYPSAAIRIIALTANAMAEDRERCLKSGMNDYLSKPLSAQVLAETLSDVHPNAVADPQSADQKPGKESDPAVDFTRLREVVGSNDEMMREISDQYLQQADEILAELDQAVQAGNRQRSSELAHKLAGSSSTCGMNAVVAPLKEIEKLSADHMSEAPRLFNEFKEQMERVRKALQNHSGLDEEPEP